MTARPTVSTPKPTVLRIGLTFLFGIGFAAVFWHQVNDLDTAQVKTLFREITLTQWVVAAFATLGSFAALGHYDALWHKALRTGISPQRAHRTGMCAVAIGQTLGFAAVIGSIVRWRKLPELASSQIVALSATVSVSFMLCWGFLAVPSLWYLMDTNTAAMPSIWVLAGLIAVVLFAANRLCQHYNIKRMIAVRLLGWSAIDMSCAALVLFVFLPGDLSVSHVIAAVILATGAGLLSNAPGGIGAFDLALIAFLPMAPLESVVSALLAYRLVYILIPFVIAAIAVSRKPQAFSELDSYDPASWGLARQTGGIARGAGWSMLLGETALGSVAIGNPQAHDTVAWSKVTGAVYKCAAPLALRLRSEGWAVIRIASEARIDPQSFQTNGSKFQSLRRKLRKAAVDGVVTYEGFESPSELVSIATAWALDHGGELGFSMGRFTQDYIATQRVFSITQDGSLKGFVTFHQAGDHWALDLIRYLPGLPDGAIHAAITAALEQAKTENATSFCLGAVPSFDGHLARFNKGRSGLSQFKRSFSPSWHPVYHAARNPVWLVLTGLAVTWAIQRPVQNLRYSRQIIKFMHAFQLCVARARGIAVQIISGKQHHDHSASTAFGRTGLDPR